MRENIALAVRKTPAGVENNPPLSPMPFSFLLNTHLRCRCFCVAQQRTGRVAPVLRQKVKRNAAPKLHAPPCTVQLHRSHHLRRKYMLQWFDVLFGTIERALLQSMHTHIQTSTTHALSRTHVFSISILVILLTKSTTPAATRYDVLSTFS